MYSYYIYKVEQYSRHSIYRHSLYRDFCIPGHICFPRFLRPCHVNFQWSRYFLEARYIIKDQNLTLSVPFNLTNKPYNIILCYDGPSLAMHVIREVCHAKHARYESNYMWCLLQSHTLIFQQNKVTEWHV